MKITMNLFIAHFMVVRPVFNDFVIARNLPKKIDF